jgi:hypothetical protein
MTYQRRLSEALRNLIAISKARAVCVDALVRICCGVPKKAEVLGRMDVLGLFIERSDLTRSGH